MNHPTFSIIVPVYNAEDTILRTLETLSQLDFPDYEVLLINDGSTDHTEQIISEFVKEDEKIRLITTKNQGPGLARNEGITRAKGKYLLFFDADDAPIKEVLSDYHTLLMEEPDSDLIISSFTFRTLSDEKLISEKDYLVPAYRYTSHELFVNDMYQLMNQQLMYVVWNKCYRRDIIEQHQIRFKNYSSCEDRIFNLNYYEHCRQVILNPKIEYIYDFEGGKGITNKYNPNKFQTFKEFYELANFVTKEKDKAGMASLFLKGTTSVIFSIYETSTRTSKEKKQEAMQILNDEAIKEAKKIALADSNAKKVTKWLYNMPAPLFLSAVKMGSFVEVKMPGLMAALKRVY
ncbi:MULTISPECIES: glycosyltransferase family 2 protein [unclassified Enterococcus]|uniref:glycosyltransferase family 2 protein n=1 Tax=unclassified Enterococcus TaxID=2608891 RepID=UPI0013EBEC18|nr:MULTISPECIES: glycosyltransferase family 2 protein [unclassified Enterococcus]